MRRHGWERPWNVLQIIGIVVFLALVLLFYIFLGLFLGNRTLKTTILTLFSALVVSVVLLHSRCSSIDPMDKISAKISGGKQPDKYSRTKAVAQLYKVVAKKIKKFEKKILQSCIKRSYTDPWKTAAELEAWMPPSDPKSDVNTPSKISGVEIALCIYCNKHMKKTSKHCRQCDKCVDGFDHHCKWLNTCIGRKNYTTFMLLLSSLLLMLVLEGSTGIFVFIRCFASKGDMSNDLRTVFGYKFPTVLLAVIAAAVVAMTAYSTAALGQLFLFHMVLIKKGIRTYDYLLAMREEYDPEELDEESDGYSSASASPVSIRKEPAEIKSPSRVSKLISKVGSLIKESQTERSLDQRRLSFEHDLESGVAQTSSKQQQQQEQPQSKANIDPCKLIKLKTDAILKGAEKARAKSSALKNPQQQQSLAEEGPQKKLSPSMKVSNIRNGNHNNNNVSVLKPLSPEKKLGPSLRDSYVAPVADGDMEAIPLLVRNATKRKPKLIHRQDLEVDISWSEPPFPLNSISSPKLPSSKPKKKQSSKSSVPLLSKENFNPNVPRILGTTNNNEQKKQGRSRN